MVKGMLEQLLPWITSSNVYSIEWSITVLRSLEWLRRYRYLISERANPPLFNLTFNPTPFLDVVSGQTLNADNPSNSYMLVRKVGTGAGKVLYVGTMPHVKKEYLTSPFRMNEQQIEPFCDLVLDIICLANEWLDETGQEFVLDPDHYFISKQ